MSRVFTHLNWRGTRLFLAFFLIATACLATSGVSSADVTPKLSKMIRDAALAEPDQTKFLNVILLPAPGYTTADVVTAVREADGKAEADTMMAGAVTAQVRINKLDKIVADVRVQFADANMAIQPADIGQPTAGSSGVDYAGLDKAPAAWAAGYDGRGVGIAVIDSGVSPSPDFGSRLVRVQLPGQTNTLDDLHGHGSMVAGVAAGQNANGYYRGVAPGATVYSLKVAQDGTSGARISDVIQALDWVALQRSALNIRVVVLSLSELGVSSYHSSLLDASVEHAWRSGVVVVAAAGNLGAGSQMFAPANDPFVIAVGALETDAEAATPFSSVGVTPDGYYRPDIFAPGRKVGSILVPGSYLGLQAPLANIITPGYGFASGTSLAAPQVAGAAAILLQQRPSLTPDQVKGLLVASARPAQAGPALDVAAAVNFTAAVPDANQGVPAGNCKLWDVSRACSTPGSAYLALFDMNLAASSQTIAVTAGASWNGASWNGASWNGASWNGASWNGASWNGASWNGASWNGASWNGASWN